MFTNNDWEDEVAMERETLRLKQLATSDPPAAKQEAYLHGSRKIPGKYRLLVDTGAVDNISGGQSVQEQSAEAELAGFKTHWQPLQRPRLVSGVGWKASTCTHEAVISCRLNNGEYIKYSTPVWTRSSIHCSVPLWTRQYGNYEHLYWNEEWLYDNGPRWS